MLSNRLIRAVAAILFSAGTECAAGGSTQSQSDQITVTFAPNAESQGIYLIKAPAAAPVTCADLGASKVVLPIAWNEAGAVIATKEVDTGSVSGVPSFQSGTGCSGPTTVGTVQQVSYQIVDSKPDRNFRVYDADLGWSEMITVKNADYYVPDGSKPNSGFTVVGIHLNSGWFGSLFGGSPVVGGSWNVTPKERTSVKIVSDPDGADVWYEGVLLQKYPTTYTGSLATAFLDSLVIKKTGYRDCGAADQRPGPQDVLKHFDRIIFCKLAVRH